MRGQGYGCKKVLHYLGSKWNMEEEFDDFILNTGGAE